MTTYGKNGTATDNTVRCVRSSSRAGRLAAGSARMSALLLRAIVVISIVVSFCVTAPLHAAGGARVNTSFGVSATVVKSCPITGKHSISVDASTASGAAGPVCSAGGAAVIAFTHEAPASRMTVRNQGPAAMVMHVAVERLMLHAEGAQYEATTDVLASPANFTVGAGHAQVIRMMLRSAAEPAREIAYRLVLSGVPPTTPDAPSAASTHTLSVPIVVVPDTASVALATL